MMRGEFESMRAIHAVSPMFAPNPIAWGTFKSNPELHFFLCDFHIMDKETPNAEIFTARLAEIHKKSVSPNGKYGFHVTTYNRKLPQDCTWTDTWEECYRNNLKRMFDLGEEARGSDDDFKKIRDTVLDRAVTRLLRPLETERRSIKPCPVHGICGDRAVSFCCVTFARLINHHSGNTGTDLDTCELIVFDASTMYAHNECKSSIQRNSRGHS